MQKHSPNFFRHFLFEWVVFTLISAFIVLLLSYHQYTRHQATLDQEEVQLTNAAAASDYVIGQQLERINITLNKIRSMLPPDWQNQGIRDQLLGERLELLSSAMPSVQAVTLTNKKGQALASSKPQVVGKSFAYRDYFQLPKISPDQQTLYITPPFEGIYGDWLIAISKAVLDQQGQFAGVVFILLNAQEFKESLNSLRPGLETWAVLVHGDGLVFAWEPESIAVTGQNLAKPGSLFTRHSESGQVASFFADTVALNNEVSLIAIRTIAPEHLYMNKPLILGVARNTAAIYQTLERDLLLIIIAYLLVNWLFAFKGVEKIWLTRKGVGFLRECKFQHKQN
ncbi:PDC sensor domain-containing protein [Marinospirillum insulare]|uniref:PDC sensor domain-containing protein n=1 Tax=Marinospirillum insulare TaxID=217169 RepID=UPI00047FFF83|nr:cache domain-containing protein [Marinospirillum insulare]